jgi:zinc transporter ZupT
MGHPPRPVRGPVQEVLIPFGDRGPPVLDATFLTRIDWALWAIGLGSGAATLSGGVVALRLKATTGLLFGLASGAVLGVALFDLLPEALRLGGRPAASSATCWSTASRPVRLGGAA